MIARSGRQLSEAWERYLRAFCVFEERLDGSGGPPLVRAARRAAMERFQELGFPTTRDEDWKYTSVAPIADGEFRLGAPGGKPNMDRQILARFVVEGMAGARLLFAEGRFVGELSTLPSLPEGVVLCSLAEALLRHPDQVESELARRADWREDAFTALSTAFVRDGAFLYVPDGIALEEPVHLLFVAGSDPVPRMSSPRNLILLGRDARAEVVEGYVGLGRGGRFTNAVTEAVLAGGARLDRYKIGDEGEEAYHVGTLAVHQGGGSRLRDCSVTLGGAIVRNNIRTVLDGEGAEASLGGVYLGGGDQLIDNHTTVDHARPRCNSREHYKGILGDRATGVFNGRILVREGAGKTDARQSNRGLLLGREASLNCKPQLEIFADDVKCTHGASVGFLEEDALFYLRSRGLGRQAARSALTFAFANEVLSEVELKPLRRHLENALMERLRGV